MAVIISLTVLLVALVLYGLFKVTRHIEQAMARDRDIEQKLAEAERARSAARIQVTSPSWEETQAAFLAGDLTLTQYQEAARNVVKPRPRRRVYQYTCDKCGLKWVGNHRKPPPCPNCHLVPLLK